MASYSGQLPAQNQPAAPLTGLARCTNPVPRDGKAHERFLELNQRVKAAGQTAEVVFIGDSITQGWEMNGKTVWEKYYARRHALNLGIGSDHTQHLLWRLQNGNLDGLQPKAVVLLIGVNNVPEEGNSPGDILAGIKAVVVEIRSRLPDTKILVLGIFPFRENFDPQRGKALQINQALHKIDDGKSVHFLDIGHLFVEADGRIPAEIMRDSVHPTPKGYQMWAEAMEPKLTELLGEKPR